MRIGLRATLYLVALYRTIPSAKMVRFTSDRST